MTSLPPPPALHCARHPGRETGRLCTRCGRPACSDCLVQASVGSHCVDCVRSARPATGERLKRWNSGQFDIATKTFLIANLVVFVYLIVRDGAAVGDGGRAAYDLAVARVWLADGQWWRLLTSGFIHFGMIHLAFNSLALWNVGPTLERAIGPAKFALVYLAGLLAGGAGAIIVQPNAATGGASGAIFGLFGAIAVVLWRQGINPMQTSIGSVLILNLALTFMISNISIGDHLGGLVGGAICGLVLAPPRARNQRPAWVQWAVPVAVAVVSALVAIIVSNS